MSGTKNLHGFGWADGHYLCICADCDRRHEAAKRSIRCHPCAVIAAEEWDTLSEEQRAARLRRNGKIIAAFMARTNPEPAASGNPTEIPTT